MAAPIMVNTMIPMRIFLRVLDDDDADDNNCDFEDDTLVDLDGSHFCCDSEITDGGVLSSLLLLGNGIAYANGANGTNGTTGALISILTAGWSSRSFTNESVTTSAAIGILFTPQL